MKKTYIAPATLPAGTMMTSIICASLVVDMDDEKRVEQALGRDNSNGSFWDEDDKQ